MSTGLAKIKLGYSIGAQTVYNGGGAALDLVHRAEAAGFDSLWIADHFLPFCHTGVHSPQAWVLISSALERAKRIPVGSHVTVPMYKYHPLIAAHAFATMASVHPRRVIFGVGTGEAINEFPFLNRWPRWRERAETLFEALSLISKYWAADDYFDFEGKYYRMKKVMCYDRPPEPIPILVSAAGPKMAAMTGERGYGILADATIERARDIVYPAHEKAAIASGHDPAKMEKAIVIGIGYGNPRELANKFRPLSAQMAMFNEAIDEPDPRILESFGKKVSDEFILERMFFRSSPKDFVHLISTCSAAGVQNVILDDWSINALDTIEMMESEVIPSFSR